MMDAEVPPWLNKDYLESCLQGGEHPRPVEVFNYTVQPAVPPGNNYASNIYRVIMELKYGSEDDQNLSIIVKAPGKDPVRTQLFDILQDTEARFYYHFMSKASRLVDFCFTSKSYPSPLQSVVVLEDLTGRGFKLADRLGQLDFDHCRQYSSVSSSFHAVSLAVHKTDPQLVESLGQEKLFRSGSNLSEAYRALIVQGLHCMTEYMDKTDFKRYSETVRRVTPYLFEMVQAAHKPRKMLNCLNQGDPWITNMMFRYDHGGGICEARLVDFQALRYGSPINDLMFFFWTSANQEVRESRREEFFRVYQDSLNSRLQELQCPVVLTDQELSVAVEALSPLALLVVAALVPFQVFSEPLDLQDMPSAGDQSGFGTRKITLTNCYTEYYCNNFLLSYLHQFESFGVFHYIEPNFK